MTATFDPTLATDLDRMRDALGDITVVPETAAFSPDETYLARLTDADGDWRIAGAAMARSLASRAINQPQSFTAVGDMSVSWSDRATAWLRIAAALEADAARINGSTLWVADVERSDVLADAGEYSIGLTR